MLQGILAKTGVEASRREWQAAGFTDHRDHPVPQLVGEVTRGHSLELRVKVQAHEECVATPCVVRGAAAGPRAHVEDAQTSLPRQEALVVVPGGAGRRGFPVEVGIVSGDRSGSLAGRGA
jgi:hypothetical protein